MMINELVTNKEQLKAIEFCDKILSNNFTYEYILNSIGPLVGVIYKIMTDDYVHYNLLQEYGILIGDIQEMDSISEEEKIDEIKDMTYRFKNRFAILARDILVKIAEDEKEAIDNGYCLELLKK